MAGQASGRLIEAMKLVINAKMTPYAAANRAQISLTTMYKSAIYKMWRDGDLEGAKRAMDVTRAIPRRTKEQKMAEKLKVGGSQS